MKIKDKTKMKNRKKNKSLKNKKTQNGKQILIKQKIEEKKYIYKSNTRCSKYKM